RPDTGTQARLTGTDRQITRLHSGVIQQCCGGVSNTVKGDSATHCRTTARDLPGQCCGHDPALQSSVDLGITGQCISAVLNLSACGLLHVIETDGAANRGVVS